MKGRTFLQWIPMWVVPAVLVFAIGTVWLRLSIVRTTYAIGQMDRQIHGLQEAREQLDVRMAALRSPRRLELLAKTRFGLNPPRADQIITLSDPSGSKR